MRSSVVADTIIYTLREDLRQVVADYCKMKGVSNILTPSDDNDAIDVVKRFPKGLLIIDWQAGRPAIIRVLACHHKSPSSSLRPIIVIAEEISDELIATCTEYGVSQIHTDGLDQRSIGSSLGGLIIGQTLANAVKKGLAKVRTEISEGNYKQASQTLAKLLKEHPKNLRLRVELADVLMAQDQVDQALRLVKDMDRTKPPYLRGIHLHGRCLMKLGRFDEALAVFEKAQLFNPDDVDRLVDIGNAMLKLDRNSDAAESFDRALAIEPEHTGARMGKGQCLLMDGHVNAALKIFKEITNNRELASIFNTSAVMHMRKGRFDSGMRLYSAAVKALGKDDKIHARLLFNMGIGYRRWRKPEEAKQCFEKALRFDPLYQKAKEHALVLSELTSRVARVVQNDDEPFLDDDSTDLETDLTVVQERPDSSPQRTEDDVVDFDSDFDDFDDDDDLEEEAVSSFLD